MSALRKNRQATSYELQKENAMLKGAVGRLYVELEYLKKKLEAVRLRHRGTIIRKSWAEN
jgi:hypothetical protein